MRELTTLDLTKAVSQMRSPGPDVLGSLVASKRQRVIALQHTLDTLASEIRVMECYARIRGEWNSLPCRGKLRHVLKHGVAFSPSELAVLLGEKLNTVRSSLVRMQRRGEVCRVDFGRWTGPRNGSA